MRVPLLAALMCLASSAGAAPTLDYAFPPYRMAVSPEADYPNQLQISVDEHISGYSDLEATHDFPGTMEVDRWNLTLTASTEAGKGNIYLTAIGHDGESLELILTVRVVTPFRPLPPVGLRCVGEREDEFVAIWKFQKREAGFPELTAVEYEVDGPGFNEAGRQLFGSGDDKHSTKFQRVSGLSFASDYEFRLRTSHWNWWETPSRQPSYSDWVSVTCSTRESGAERPPAPEVTHVHVYQGNLVDTFPAAGRSPRVPTWANMHGEPWRVPLIPDKRTTVIAEVLFDDWEPDVRTNGERVYHEGRVEFDQASNRLLGQFRRDLPEAPSSIVVSTDGLERELVSQADFSAGTADVPPWTVRLVPIDTPVRSVDIGEFTKRIVQRGLLQSWPFGKLEVEVGEPLTSSKRCEDDSTELLRELADKVTAPAKTIVIGLVGTRRNTNDCNVGEGEGRRRLRPIAYQGEPYILKTCGETPSEYDGCITSSPAHAFGHAAGMTHVRGRYCDEDCGPEDFPYYGALVAPTLSARPGNHTRVDLNWARAPLFWRLDSGAGFTGIMEYGARRPTGDPQASGSWRRYLLYEDLMSAGGATYSRWTHGALRSVYPSDHTYRQMLDYLRGYTTPAATGEIVE